MAVGTGNFGELLEPGIRVHYGLEYKPNDQVHPMVFEILKSKRAFEESLSYTGFGLLDVKDQGQSVSYEDPKQNWLHRLTQVTYGKGFTVTFEMKAYDQYNKMNAFAGELAKSVIATRETITSNVLNRAFNDSYTGGDGLELCSTAHLLGGGGTWQNELTTAADFSATSLEQALIDIGDMVGDSGLLMRAKAVKLVHPNEMAWDVQKLLKSTLDPDSANNTINPAKGILQPIQWNYLTDPDAWFILTDIANGLKVYNSRMPDFTRDNDFDSENAKFKTVFAMSAGWDDPRGVFGSPGA